MSRPYSFTVGVPPQAPPRAKGERRQQAKHRETDQSVFSRRVQNDAVRRAETIIDVHRIAVLTHGLPEQPRTDAEHRMIAGDGDGAAPQVQTQGVTCRMSCCLSKGEDDHGGYSDD